MALVRRTPPSSPTGNAHASSQDSFSHYFSHTRTESGTVKKFVKTHSNVFMFLSLISAVPQLTFVLWHIFRPGGREFDGTPGNATNINVTSIHLGDCSVGNNATDAISCPPFSRWGLAKIVGLFFLAAAAAFAQLYFTKLMSMDEVDSTGSSAVGNDDEAIHQESTEGNKLSCLHSILPYGCSSSAVINVLAYASRSEYTGAIIGDDRHWPSSVTTIFIVGSVFNEVSSQKLTVVAKILERHPDSKLLKLLIGMLFCPICPNPVLFAQSFTPAVMAVIAASSNGSLVDGVMPNTTNEYLHIGRSILLGAVYVIAGSVVFMNQSRFLMSSIDKTLQSEVLKNHMANVMSFWYGKSYKDASYPQLGLRALHCFVTGICAIPIAIMVGINKLLDTMTTGIDSSCIKVHNIILLQMCINPATMAFLFIKYFENLPETSERFLGEGHEWEPKKFATGLIVVFTVFAFIQSFFKAIVARENIIKKLLDNSRSSESSFPPTIEDRGEPNPVAENVNNSVSIANTAQNANTAVAAFSTLSNPAAVDNESKSKESSSGWFSLACSSVYNKVTTVLSKLATPVYKIWGNEEGSEPLLSGGGGEG